MRLFFALFFLVMLNSCSPKYMQFFYTTGVNTELKNGSWVFENDTLSITYYYYAKNGVMYFDIYNKLSKPIYIDWKNSAYINNENKINYWVDEQKTASNSFTFGQSWRSNPYTSKNFNTKEFLSFSNTVTSQVSVKPERVSFLPPKSKIGYGKYVLIKDFAFDLGKYPNLKQRESSSDGNKTILNVYQVEFNNSSSPLHFRNFLAITFSENSTELHYIDNAFYLTKVIEVKQGVKPDDINNTNFFISDLKEEFGSYIPIAERNKNNKKKRNK